MFSFVADFKFSNISLKCGALELPNLGSICKPDYYNIYRLSSAQTFIILKIQITWIVFKYLFRQKFYLRRYICAPRALCAHIAPINFS